MAIESKRGCGYRKVGGLYIVARPEEMISISCDRLPIPLHVCPVCSQGIKFSRGWTWIDPFKLFEGDHGDECTCYLTCPACVPSFHFRQQVEGTELSEPIENDKIVKAGLVWVGEKYYSPESFCQELREQGFSKRISALPKGYKPGVTWIFTAHKKAVVDPGGDQVPGIFYAVQAPRVEKIVLQSEFDSYVLWKKLTAEGDREEAVKADGVPDHVVELYKLEQRGIDLVPVPDDDKDHNPNAPEKQRHLMAV
jgi:hypothetical protein